MPLEPEIRDRALRLLLILSVLRKNSLMPVDIDPMDTFYLRMLIEKSRSEGLAESYREGEAAMLRLLLARPPLRTLASLGRRTS